MECACLFSVMLCVIITAPSPAAHPRRGKVYWGREERPWATILQVLLCKWGTPGIVHLRAYLFFRVWSTHFSAAQFMHLRNGWRRRASCCVPSRWPLTEKAVLDTRWENVSWKSVLKVILNIGIDKMTSDDCRSMPNERSVSELPLTAMSLDHSQSAVISDLDRDTESALITWMEGTSLRGGGPYILYVYFNSPMQYSWQVPLGCSSEPGQSHRAILPVVVQAAITNEGQPMKWTILWQTIIRWN